MKKLITIFLVFVATTALLAQNNVITYTASSKLPEVYGEWDAGLHINAFNTSITDHSFANGQGTITFTNDVTDIQSNAFYECTSVKSIIIPNSVINIGQYAFASCSSLSSFTIPNSVTSVGASIFNDCTSLKSVAISTNITKISQADFYGCTSLASINIPNSVTVIEHNAFCSCESLTDITIGNNVTSIEDLAFCNCSSLQNIIIPNSVKKIGCLAFSSCSSLTDIIIPNSVTSLGNSAFQDCTSLSSVTLSDSLKIIETNTFNGCSSLKSITIPYGITKIDACAFDECSSLKSVSFPSSLITIGGGAFHKTALTSVIIPNSVTKIEYSAFEWCRALTSVTIGSGVSSIGDGAFMMCSDLKTITCYATTPPVCEDMCFTYISQSIPVFVPFDAVAAYKTADQWKDFTNIQAISAASVNIPSDDVLSNPTANAVILSWPANSNADKYSVIIKRNGDIFYTYVFNSKGQLISVDQSAPSRRMSNIADAVEVVGGYSFTINGLETNTLYTYEVVTKDAGGTPIANYSGNFTTTDVTAINQLTDSPSDRFTKIIRNGQILILRDAKTYNAQGGEL